MQVRELLKVKGGDVKSVAPETTLQEAAAWMTENDVGFAVVCGPGFSIQGVLSERDIITTLAKRGASALDMPAGEVMQTDIHVVSSGDSLHDAISKMSEGRVRHLPVCNGTTLVGVVSARDALTYVGERASDQDRALLWSKIAWA